MSPSEHLRLERKLTKVIKHLRRSNTDKPRVQEHELRALCEALWDMDALAQEILVRLKKRLHEKRGS